MWMTGKITKKELKRLEKMGYEVTIIDVHSFNKLLDPKYNPSFKYDLTKDKVLVSVYIDADLTDSLCRLEP
jgi:hypothetical protein